MNFRQNGSMRARIFLAVHGIAALLGCGPTDVYSASLSDAPAAVTDGPGDALVRVTIAQGAGIPPAMMQVWIRPAGGTITSVGFEHTDADSDGTVNAGDTLLVLEPPVNLIGTANIGTMYTITLVEQISAGRVRTLWEGVWTAN